MFNMGLEIKWWSCVIMWLREIAFSCVVTKESTELINIITITLEDYLQLLVVHMAS